MLNKNTAPARKSSLSRPQRHASGAALVVTLLFLVLISIMLVTMSDGLRVERVAAGSNLDRTRAGHMAERGVEQVVATLSKETADVNRNWASQPGQLILGAETDDTATPVDERKVLTGAVAVSGTTNPAAARITPLHSGTASAAILSTPNTMLQPPNLNIPISADANEHLITDKIDPATTRAVTMRPKWIYLRKDATLDTNETPVMTNSANPITGRYAFWTDDEGGKLNVNLAWSRENSANTLSQASATRLSLAALGLTEDEATAFHNNVTADNFTTINRLFNSPDDSRPQDLSGLIRGVNKFDTTHYNHDPDTTFFNESRIVLTTQANKAGTKPFLDILTVPNSDPGLVANISQAKINATIDKLKIYLERTDWPMVEPSNPPKSFQSKYFNNDASRLVQLALGIIEYVRSVESPLRVVQPLRLAGNTLPSYDIIKTGGPAARDDTFIGNPRRFYVTELGVWRANLREIAGPNIGRLKVRFYIEVHLPENHGIDEIDLLNPDPGSGSKLFVFLTGAHQPALAFNAAGEDAYIANYPGIPPDAPGSPAYEVKGSNIVDVASGSKRIMLPGEYRTLVYELWLDPSKILVPTNMGITPTGFVYAPNPAVPVNPVDGKDVWITLRFALMFATGPGVGTTETETALRLEVVPLGSSSQSTPLLVRSRPGIPEPASITTMPLSNIGSVETNDPRVNALAVDWTPQEDHSMGRINASNATRGASSLAPLPTTAPYPPQPDTSSNGRFSTASFRMPYPKGHTKNPFGLVQSPGELGFIHTGLEGKSKGAPAKLGIPWRTLRLQPSRYTDTKEVPDWALMDLFTVPSVVPAVATTLFAPYGTAIAGRVNLNATAAEPFGLQHRAALAAVLLNARKSSVVETAKLNATEAATLADAIFNRTLADKKVVGAKTLLEGKQYGYTAGYDSPGEVAEIKGIADGGEESEELVRSISNLLTTRSNVFSVYSIGQAIKQTPSGKLIITAEQRQHSMVERYLNTNNKVNFRSVYFRNINP